MTTTTPDAALADAAEALFTWYPSLSRAEHEAAVAAFAGHHRPYFDQPRGRWLVGSYHQARAVLRDHRFGNDLRRAAIATNSERLHHRLSPDAPSLLFIDPPEHDGIKRELGMLFRREALAAHRGPLRERWRQELHRLGGGEVDLGHAVVHPICVAATFAVLGLAPPPADTIPALVEDLYQVNLLFDLNASAEQRVRSQEANARLRTMVAGLLPGSAVADRMSAGGASDDVIVSTTVFMLRAGVVTVGSLLLSLLAERCPAGQPGRPPGDLPSLLIRHTPTGDTGRVTLSDVELGGQFIPAGSTVIALISAANAQLVSTGASLAGHLVFGAGAHRCVGERLVRMQAELATEAADELGCRLLPGREVPHRTPSFRGYRQITVRQDD